MSIIQITKKGTTFSGTKEDLKKLQIEFDKKHCVKLPKLLASSLLKLIQKRINDVDFKDKSYKHLGIDSKELRLKDDATVGILEFLANDQKLYELIEQITGCPKIGCFAGRIYRMSPNLGIYDAWHDDDVYNRIVAMSINLSTEVYSGGVLQILDFNSRKIINEVTNTNFGDAILIKISPNLQHRVTEVIGKASRTAFAGFFHSSPLYKPIFKPYKDAYSKNISNKLTRISKDSIVQVQPELFSHKSNGQLLVFNSRNTSCYGLNVLSEKILNTLTKPIKVRKLCNSISSEYDIDTGKCENDLIKLLSELKTNDLITVNKKTYLKNNNILKKASWKPTKCGCKE